MERLALADERLTAGRYAAGFANALASEAARSDWPVEAWRGPVFSQTRLRLMGELIHQVWPKAGVTPHDRAVQLGDMIDAGQRETGRSAWAFVVHQAERMVAQAVVIPRWINWSGRDLLIGGLARVGTHPSARGQGFGQQTVRAAMALVDHDVFSCLLFQTSFMVRPFYLRLGAGDVTNPVINSLAVDRNARPFKDEVVMRYPAGEYARGVVDLRGPGY